MSEVQRYTYEVDDGVFAECVLGEDYDAAQSELAALREELQTRTADLLACGTRRKAAEQRNEELTQALERGKLWLELFRARFGDYGVSKEDHMSIIRTIRSLPHPPTEFDKPTESGASE